MEEKTVADIVAQYLAAKRVEGESDRRVTIARDALGKLEDELEAACKTVDNARSELLKFVDSLAISSPSDGSRDL
jgi:hypothetical protein